MPNPRHALWVLAIAIPSVIGAGTLYRVLAPNGVSAPPPASKGAKIQVSGPRRARVLELVEDRGLEGARRQVEAYRDWASEPHALGARKLILATFFSERNVPTKLSNVLEAVQADSTPVEQDPLWGYVVEQLSAVWEGETASKGMDLMFAEQRPRAKRALIASFAHLATTQKERLDEQQHQKLTEYFIDMHRSVEPEQQQEVDRALRTLAGNDVVDILNGNGLGAGDQKLESEREYEQALAETASAMAQAPEDARSRSAPAPAEAEP
jgi:hypothetical protein